MTIKPSARSNSILRKHHPCLRFLSRPAGPYHLSTPSPHSWGQILVRLCDNRPPVNTMVPFSMRGPIQTLVISGGADEICKPLSSPISHWVANPDHLELICQSQGNFIMCSLGVDPVAKAKVIVLTNSWPVKWLRSMFTGAQYYYIQPF